MGRGAWAGWGGDSTNNDIQRDVPIVLIAADKNIHLVLGCRGVSRLCFASLEGAWGRTLWAEEKGEGGGRGEARGLFFSSGREASANAGKGRLRDTSVDRIVRHETVNESRCP